MSGKVDPRRDAARALGLKRFKGDPCRNGHIGERYVSSTDCVDCCLVRTRGLSLPRTAQPAVEPIELLYGAPLRGPNARSV